MKNKERDHQLRALAYLTLVARLQPLTTMTHPERKKHLRYWRARSKLFTDLPDPWRAWVRMVRE